MPIPACECATWGYTDSIRLNDPERSFKALSIHEDASAHQRVKESSHEPEMLLYVPIFSLDVWNVLVRVLDRLACVR